MTARTSVSSPQHTPQSAAAGPARAEAGPPSGTVTLGLRRIRYELLLYFRAADQVFFGFSFPVLMYAIFATVFSAMGSYGADAAGAGGISAAAYYLPGLIASAILISGVQTLGIDIAIEKGDGSLKRLGGTPLSPTSYFIGKLGLVVVASLIQIILLLIFARFGFGVGLPSDGGSWLILAWVYVLGIGCCAFLGIAASALARSGKSAPAVIIPVVLIPQFISGVYVQFTMLPEWLQHVANVLPLAWIARGMRAALLPEEFAQAETGGVWNLGLAALLIGAWCVAGLILAKGTFRWNRSEN